MKFEDVSRIGWKRIEDIELDEDGLPKFTVMHTDADVIYIGGGASYGLDDPDED